VNAVSGGCPFRGGGKTGLWCGLWGIEEEGRSRRVSDEETKKETGRKGYKKGIGESIRGNADGGDSSLNQSQSPPPQRTHHNLNISVNRNNRARTSRTSPEPRSWPNRQCPHQQPQHHQPRHTTPAPAHPAQPRPPGAVRSNRQTHIVGGSISDKGRKLRDRKLRLRGSGFNWNRSVDTEPLSLIFVTTPGCGVI